MLKKNKIRGYLHYNKSELIDVLIKRRLIPETISITTITSLPERENTKKEINPKYNFLKHIRNSPKKVEIRDIETDEINNNNASVLKYRRLYQDNNERVITTPRKETHYI